MNTITTLSFIFLFVYDGVSDQSTRKDESVIKRSRRMIGGKKAYYDQWPFIVSLSFKQPKAPFQICSGTLISKNWVVTAAHCVADIKHNPEHLIAKISQPKTDGDDIMTFGVVQIKVHELFLWKQKLLPSHVMSWDFDIALVKLNRSMPDSWPVARLSTRQMHSTKCKSAGWGSRKELKNWNDTAMKNYKVSNTLQEIDVPLVPWHKCHDFYTSDHKAFAKYNFKIFCGGAITPNNTTRVGGCIGDSGSPLMCREKKSMVLFGIMLGGHPLCTLGKSYIIFTNVPLYINWIKRASGSILA